MLFQRGRDVQRLQRHVEALQMTGVLIFGAGVLVGLIAGFVLGILAAAAYVYIKLKG